TSPLRVYLTNLTIQEITTVALIQKALPETTFYVHVDLVEQLKNPRENFLQDHYDIGEQGYKRLAKTLPSELENIYGYDKTSSFETEKTKLLMVPFSGPHKGHTMIYSRDHKLLCAGLLLGRTSDAYSYFLDLTGSYQQYLNGLSFLEKAKSEIIFPAYNEPEFTKSLEYKSKNIREAMQDDMDNLVSIIGDSSKPIDRISSEYVSNYSERYRTPPYDIIDLQYLKVSHLLQVLTDEKKVILQEDQYRLNK
ncbi:MAG: hypothetical protein ACXAE3_17410, partial [Candidatus Kariarchaeaceae archaeon]